MGPSGAPVGSQMGAQRLARTEDRVRIRADIYAKTALTAKTGCGALLGSGPRHQVHPAGQREAWVKLVPSKVLMFDADLTFMSGSAHQRGGNSSIRAMLPPGPGLCCPVYSRLPALRAVSAW